MKVMTILGTRPEIIRLSRVMALLDETQQIEHVLVHTGQNYDYELNQVFFDDLGVKRPDHFLNVDTSSLGRVYGDVLIKSEEVLRNERPDAVLILGDTNSAIASIMAKRMHIPIVHMEAGNRSFDWRVPEEVNRHLVDSIADLNLVYTEHARRNLLREGIPPQAIYLSGSPMFEVLDYYREQIEASSVLEREALEPGRYFVVSLHREENVDNVPTLTDLVRALDELAAEFDVPAVISLHPRTKKRLAEFDIDLDDHPRLRPQKPYGFFDYNRLQQQAMCVVSDSGTVSEESAILQFPAVTPRRSMERPEGLDAGNVILTGPQAEDVVRAVHYSLARDMTALTSPVEYKVRDCANRVMSILLSRPLGVR